MLNDRLFNCYINNSRRALLFSSVATGNYSKLLGQIKVWPDTDTNLLLFGFHFPKSFIYHLAILFFFFAIKCNRSSWTNFSWKSAHHHSSFLNNQIIASDTERKREAINKFSHISCRIIHLIIIFVLELS